MDGTAKQEDLLGGNDIVLAILAAGASSRMNASKLTMPFGGTTLLENALSAAQESKAGNIVVVTGFHRESVCEIMHRYDGVGEVFNPHYAEGQAASVRAAAEHAGQNGYPALIIMVADQPFITSEDIDALIQAAVESGKEAVVTASAGKRGNPCLFRASLYPSLMLLQGDEGARALIRNISDDAICILSSKNPLVHVDIDTPEDYARFNTR